MLNQIKKKHKRAGKLCGIPALFLDETINVDIFIVSYDQQILKILTEAGERGISVQNISRHVYNLNCTFFHQPDYEEVRSYVQQYLLKNSKSQQSLIESTGQRGYYRLNTTGSKDAQQLMLLFRDDIVNDDVQPSTQQDLSLDLFDGVI